MELKTTTIPHVTFLNQKDGSLQRVYSEELFKGKKVLVIGLPGAFTPTCSSLHIPRYENLALYFKNKGIDEIVCISVNDGFVMEAWGKDQNLKHVKLLSDGNGDFTRELGLLVDKKKVGFGDRSWRYSLYVEDGKIVEAFIEPDKAGDPFEVSDADTMWKKLYDEAVPPVATVFSKKGCHLCKEAKDILEREGIVYEEFCLENGKVSLNSVKNITGVALVPRIYFDDKLIGGLLDLKKKFKKEE